MYHILADAYIPGLEHFFPSTYFQLNLYENISELKTQVSKNDILITRSIYPINADVLQNAKIKLIATATSGINHIDTEYLQSQHIKLLDAKGGNAPSVVDYICASLASLQKHFHFQAHNIAIIGYGHVGKKLSQRLTLLGYQIGVYDPLLPEDSIPKHLKIEPSQLHQFDTICVHANYHTTSPYPSINLIDSRLKHEFTENTCIINAARGQIVDEAFILSDDYQGIYCADVFENEPNPNPAIIMRATLATPHIAGHSIESKLRMTEIISNKIHDYLQLEEHPKSLSVKKLEHINTEDWQTKILSKYDPFIESMAFKQEPAQGFFKLRPAHHRHEFDW